MNGLTRSLCTVEDIRNQEYAEGRRLRLTLTHQDQSEAVRTAEQPRDKPVGRAFALVQPASDRTAFHPEPLKSAEEQVEIIKVYLEANRQQQQKQQQSLKMLSDEVSQIQEVRYCLKNLREQMAAKHKPQTNGWKVGNPFRKNVLSSQKGGAKADEQEADDEEERNKLREVSKRLYEELQETKKKHLEDKEKLQVEGSRLREHLSSQEEKLRVSKEDCEKKDQRIEELHRLMQGMEKESVALKEKITRHEDELQNIRGKGQRAEELEKEVATLKEKIHHLDDMLKSQQRKVRNMIEQIQNSRVVIQHRDRVIKELEEKVGYLEAENREMQARIQYFTNRETYRSKQDSQVLYSAQLKPSTSSNRPLPLIKVIELKS